MQAYFAFLTSILILNTYDEVVQ